MRPTGTPEQLERRRWPAFELLTQDRPPVEVARMVAVNRRSVRRWKAAYRKKGRQTLEARPAASRGACQLYTRGVTVSRSPQ
jgi:transposase